MSTKTDWDNLQRFTISFAKDICYLACVMYLWLSAKCNTNRTHTFSAGLLIAHSDYQRRIISLLPLVDCSPIFHQYRTTRWWRWWRQAANAVRTVAAMLSFFVLEGSNDSIGKGIYLLLSMCDISPRKLTAIVLLEALISSCVLGGRTVRRASLFWAPSLLQVARGLSPTSDHVFAFNFIYFLIIIFNDICWLLQHCSLSSGVELLVRHSIAT